MVEIQGNGGVVDPTYGRIQVDQDISAAHLIGSQAKSDSTYLSTLNTLRDTNATQATLQSKITDETTRLNTLEMHKPSLEAAHAAHTISDSQYAEFQKSLSDAKAAITQSQTVLANLVGKTDAAARVEKARYSASYDQTVTSTINNLIANGSITENQAASMRVAYYQPGTADPTISALMTQFNVQASVDQALGKLALPPDGWNATQFKQAMGDAYTRAFTSALNDANLSRDDRTAILNAHNNPGQTSGLTSGQKTSKKNIEQLAALTVAHAAEETGSRVASGNPFFATGSYTSFFLAMMQVVEIMKQMQIAMGQQMADQRQQEASLAASNAALDIKIGDANADKAIIDGYCQLAAGGATILGAAGGAVGSIGGSPGSMGAGLKIGSEMGTAGGQVIGGALKIYASDIDRRIGGYNAQKTGINDAYQATQGIRGKMAEQFSAAGDLVSSATQQMTQTSQVAHQQSMGGRG